MADFSIHSLTINEPPLDLTSDIEWLNNNLKLADKQVVRSNWIGNVSGGLSAKMTKIELHFSDGSSKTYIVKATPKENERACQLLGQPRESLFYNLFHNLSKLNIRLPETLYSYGNMATGAKTIILEDLSTTAINSGYFFGNGSPLNWSINLEAYTSLNEFKDINMCLEISKLAFTTAAIMHGHYFMDSSILTNDWLRGSAWIDGNDKDSWLAAQFRGKDNWATAKDKIATSGYTVQWDERVIACMDSSMNKINWEDYQSNLKTSYWTLVHGDFHPSNMMITRSNPFHLYVLDWEVVGIGSGPQDIAQYLISHMNPKERLQYEDELISLYYNTFIVHCDEKFKSVYSLDKCKEDFVMGGVCRWVWFLAILSVMCPDQMVQYFHDQVLAFMIDHNITPDNIAMPRV